MSHEEAKLARKALIESATHGDAVAMDALIESYLPRLRAFVRVRMDPALRARESCSDIVQSVCRELIGQLDDFEYRGEDRFRGWLFASALNKIREKHRYHHREKRDIDRELRIPDTSAFEILGAYATVCRPSQDVIAREEVARIESAFDRLPEDYKQVIALARIAGLPHAEIAHRMRRSVPAVRQLLGRALVKLTDELGEA